MLGIYNMFTTFLTMVLNLLFTLANTGSGGTYGIDVIEG